VTRIVTFWALLFSLGLALGAMIPYVGPWATQRFGASSQLIGLLFACGAAASMVGGPLVGVVTDRIGSRRGAIVGCFGLSGMGMVIMSRADILAVGMVGMVAASTGGIAMGLLLVSAGDVARRRQSESGERLGSGAMSLVRMGYSLGFVMGAPLGGILAQAAGYDGLLRIIGLSMIVVAGIALPVLPATNNKTPVDHKVVAARGSLWPLILFCLAGLLVMMSDQAKIQFLPLRLTEQLHLQPATVGLLFGVQAALELIVMPLAGRIADRVGLAPVLLLTFALPIPYMLGVSSTTNLTLLFALQGLQAAAVAGFNALAFVQAQTLAPGREGFATTLYGAGFSASRVATGLLFGSIAQQVGIAGSLRLSVIPVVIGWLLLVVGLRYKPATLGSGSPHPAQSP
jgi:SET family sugar efflux transporter-like MFS transporter